MSINFDDPNWPEKLGAVIREGQTRRDLQSEPLYPAPTSERVQALEEALRQIDQSWTAATSGRSTDIPKITGWTGSLDNYGQIFAWVARAALNHKSS